MSPIKGLACFDFDWSLIETDSDRFVIQALSPELGAKLLQSPMQWTDLQNQCLKEFHEQGGSGQVIRDALTRVPMDEDMIRVCRLLALEEWMLAIVSDANSFYIEAILEHYNIRNLFSAIITNPAHWDPSSDRLHIQRLIPADGIQHNCKTGVCSLNICKGQEVDKLIRQIQSSHLAATPSPPPPPEHPQPRMLYVGDGQNDYCPALRMKENDLYFVRKGRSLERYLAKDPKIREAIKARIIYWDTPAVILQELSAAL